MRNIGSKFFVALVLAAIVGGLGYAFWPEPIAVDLATVDRGLVRITVDEDGKTRIREKYVVSAPLFGRLLRINMDAGDPVVAEKTLLATIEPPDPILLDARTIAQAEARAKAAEAALKKMEPQLEEVRVSQAFAEAELARVRKAAAAVSRSDLENAELLYRQRSEELRSMRIQEEIAQFELEQAQAALLRTKPREEQPVIDGDESTPSNDNNGWTFTIYSPIDGRVLRVFQESASVVSSGTPLLELGDPTDLEAEIDVLSRDAVKIKPGALVLFEHWGGNGPLHGRVQLVEPSGFTKISTLGVEEQRVNVIVDLVDPPSVRTELGDGFRVEARIVIDEADDVLRVPTSALFRVGDKSAVYRVVDGVVHLTTVEIGRQNGLQAEVLGGLSAGDQVVIHPSDQVDDNVRVRNR